MIILCTFTAFLCACSEDCEIKIENFYAYDYGPSVITLKNTGDDLKDIEVTFNTFGINETKTATRKIASWKRHEIKEFEFTVSECVTASTTLVITIHADGKEIFKNTSEWDIKPTE